MKAAPDKIYLNKYMFREGMLYKSQYPVTPDIEYIRKDALLEWIQEARAIPHENAIVRDLTFQEVINKLNSIQ